MGLYTPAQAETIESSILSALQTHPSVEAAKAFLRASEEDYKSEYSGYYPEVAVTGTGGRLFGDNATTRGLTVTRGSAYSYLWEGSASLTQTVFDGFETSSRVSAAKAREKSANMDLLNARETLALRAAQAYINVMRTQTGLGMLKAHQGKVKDYIERIKISVDQGASDEAEYQQARDVKVLLDGIVTEYEAQSETAKALYFEAIGGQPEGDLEVPKPNQELILDDMEEAIVLAEKTHPSLQSAVFSAEAAKESIASEKATLYPGVDGELSYLRSDKQEELGGEIIDTRAVLRMNWQFETGLGQLSRVRKKRHELKEAKAREQEVKRQLASTIRQSYAELKNAEGQFKHQKERYGLNRKLFNTYEAQFEGAKISLLQLMQAHNQLFNVKLEKLNAEYRVLAAKYSVLASLGQLQQSIQLAHAAHSPEQNGQ